MMSESVQKHIRTQLKRLQREADPYGATVQLQKNNGSHFQFYICDRSDRKMQLQSCASGDPRAFKNNLSLLRRWLRQGGPPPEAEAPAPKTQSITPTVPTTDGAFDKMMRLPDEPPRQSIVLPQRLSDLLDNREALFEEREALLVEQERLLARREDLSRRHAVLNREIITALVELLQGMPDLPDLELDAPAAAAAEANARMSADDEPAAFAGSFRDAHNNELEQAFVDIARRNDGTLASHHWHTQLIADGLIEPGKRGAQKINYVLRTSKWFEKGDGYGCWQLTPPPRISGSRSCEVTAHP